MKTLLLVAASLALTAAGGAQQRRAEPRFKDYPAAAVRRAGVTPMNLRSHRLARTYRTLLRRQQRESGVNFAGHYTLASVGCGTGCSVTAIIDARTGAAHFPSQLNGWTGIVGDYDPPEGEDTWEYRADSRLLRILGRPGIGREDEERYGPSGIYYYVWDGGRLRQVGFRPVGSYPESDPPGRR
ncbi:MAG TPA: hypothetical protein VGX48_06145 [Pyrinomonadaceae bacterium]|jgi:hypothetical protein|nr:hypothetical protein [Pyrinomonadaceae bacterium]